MRIGEMARRTGISIRMIRYYEEEGFLNPRRSSAGYRIYSPAEQVIIDRIIILQKGGLTLDVIRKITPCVINNGPTFEPCDALKLILMEQMRSLNERIATLEYSRDVLSEFFQGVAGGPNISVDAALHDNTLRHQSSREPAKRAPLPSKCER